MGAGLQQLGSFIVFIFLAFVTSARQAKYEKGLPNSRGNEEAIFIENDEIGRIGIT